MENPEVYRKNLPYYRDEIAKCTYRQFTTGFFFHKPTHETQIYDSNTYIRGYVYLGQVEKQDENGALFEQRNKFSVGDEIEIMRSSGEDFSVKVLGMTDLDGNSVESCPHPKQKIYLKTNIPLQVYDILRCREDKEFGGQG